MMKGEEEFLSEIFMHEWTSISYCRCWIERDECNVMVLLPHRNFVVKLIDCCKCCYCQIVMCFVYIL